MSKQCQKRRKIRTAAFISFLVFALFVSTVTALAKASKLERNLNAASQRSLNALSSYISSINSDLTKGIYANSPTMLNSIAQNLTRDASAAKNALAALPVSDVRLDNTFKFLSQVASFVASLDRKAVESKGISAEQRQQMKSLKAVSETLSGDISGIISDIESGQTSLKAENKTMASLNKNLLSVSSALSKAEQEINDYPKLIFDGPFSDHILSKQSELLRAAQEITLEEARERAAAFLGVSAEKVINDGESEGTVAAYNFTVRDMSIAVSKRGGLPVYMLSSAFAGEEKISVEKARQTAANFLRDKGFPDMTDSYYFISDGICTLNFAYSKDGVVCYPDLIKVGVNLENGRIVSFDATGYIMNHTERNLSEPKFSSKQAAEKLASSLEILACKRAVIPTDYATEQDCYEFHCKDEDGQELLIYIDTETLEEDEILILLYSDNGILTK